MENAPVSAGAKLISFKSHSGTPACTATKWVGAEVKAAFDRYETAPGDNDVATLQFNVPY
jgi:hypothetical protein